MVVLSRRDVEAILDMEGCMAAMVEALKGFSAGAWWQPHRQQTRIPGQPLRMGLMPAYRGAGRRLVSLKEMVVAPGNPARGLDSHQGAVLLHDGEDGRLVAVVDATSITAIRTAAASAVATRALAREDVQRIAVLGTGAQARSHVAAMRCVFPAAEIAIWGRSSERAEALADEVGGRACATVSSATAGAGVICTVTAAAEPILDASSVAPGCHINAAGASSPGAREIAADLVAASCRFVDSRVQATVECGEFLLAMRDGALAADAPCAELGEVLLGKHPGRGDPQEITLFKSLGLGVEDLAAAQLVLELATQRGLGTHVPW